MCAAGFPEKNYEFEKVIIITNALVPTVWGFWNMLYVATRKRWRWSIGLHGAIRPFVRHPLGILLGYLFQAVTFNKGGLTYFGQPQSYVLLISTVALDGLVYYLLRKYLVGYVNRMLEID